MSRNLGKTLKRLGDTETELQLVEREKLQIAAEKAALEQKAKVTEAQVRKLKEELEMKSLSKLQQQKVVLECSPQHLQAEHEALKWQATTHALDAAQKLAEAQPLNAKACQQHLLNPKTDADMCCSAFQVHTPSRSSVLAPTPGSTDRLNGEANRPHACATPGNTVNATEDCEQLLATSGAVRNSFSPSFSQPNRSKRSLSRRTLADIIYPQPQSQLQTLHPWEKS
jgi:hypothetical protein